MKTADEIREMAENKAWEMYGRETASAADYGVAMYIAGLEDAHALAPSGPAVLAQIAEARKAAK